MDKLTEKRVREIAREEVLKREMEKVRDIAQTDALAKKMTEERQRSKISK